MRGSWFGSYHGAGPTWYGPGAAVAADSDQVANLPLVIRFEAPEDLDDDEIALIVAVIDADLRGRLS